jgi:predicted Zn finger-like uncharacterized protein
MATGLATRCSACGTVFRVVPDQLRVSEGWVRCGRCTQVFNALESLVDLESGLPRHNLGPGLAPPADEAVDDDFAIAEPAAKPGSPPLPGEPPPHVESFAATEPPPRVRPADAGDTEAEVSTPPIFADAPPEHVAAAVTSDVDLPSFVRHAQRAERWRRPQVRAALSLLSVLLLAGLAAQAAHTWRDQLAARLPQTRPWLEQACAQLGCELGPARAIERLAVESSGLVRVERSNLYKLQVALRNRGDIALAVPALDVTLTDTQGRLVARKVLRLAELGATQATIAAGRELNVQATLQTTAVAAGDSQPSVIAGYTIDLFYP